MPTRKLPCWITPTLLVGALPTRIGYAKDMMGPDGLELLMALPKVALYAVGELSLVLAPLLGLLAILSWIVSRAGAELGSRMPGAASLAVLATITAVPAVIYLVSVPKDPSDPFTSYRSTTTTAAKVAALEPPVGRSWPGETGYLDMPQGAQGGHGVIRVSSAFGLKKGAYVKLCEARKQPCPGLRHAFVQKLAEFSFRDLPPGEYEVRYMPIHRPTVGGRSQPITISEYVEDPHVVKMTDSPVLESNYPVVGIWAKDF